MNLKHTLTALFAVPLLAGCGDKNAATDSGSTDDSRADDSAGPGGIVFTPGTAQSIPTYESLELGIDGLDPATAYRVTLVLAENVTTNGDGTGTFVSKFDGTSDVVDPGSSEYVVVIDQVNLEAITPANTAPAQEDPNDPSGIFPRFGGLIVVNLTSAGSAGTVYPVFHVNGGNSTHLEITDGVPTEFYVIGPAITGE